MIWLGVVLVGGGILMYASHQRHKRCLCHKQTFPTVADRVTHERKACVR